jgi:redox-regulated HSP33 family molecular chaperone
VSIPVQFLSFAPKSGSIEGIGRGLNATAIGTLLGTTSVAARASSSTAAPASDPESRFQRLNTHFRTRHVGKDHIVHGQHFDVRVAAVRSTATLRDAAQRHSMMAEEAAFWGPMAAGASLYASLLRGDERVKVEVALTAPGAPGGDEDVNTAYIEGFAVGEVRGYAKFEQLRVAKALAGLEASQAAKAAAAAAAEAATEPEAPESDAASSSALASTPAFAPDAGTGVMQVSKILYGMHRPYTSKTHATADAASNWNDFFANSEQIASFLHLEYDVAAAAGSTPGPAAAAAAATPAVAAAGATPAPEAGAAAAPSSRLSPVSEEDVRFCGGVLVQVLAGAPDPALAAEILAERAAAKAAADAAAVTAVSSKAGAGSETVGGQGHVEETDDSYVKRVQMERLRARVRGLDMQRLMGSCGVAGYVAAVLGEGSAIVAAAGAAEGAADAAAAENAENAETETTTPAALAALGATPSAVRESGWNLHGEFDFEALERRLISSTYAQQQLAKDPETVRALYGENRGWAYRPVAFFCRCSQAKPEEKLRQLPVDVLDELAAEGEAVFTCEFCRHEVVCNAQQLGDAAVAVRAMLAPKQ